MEFKELMHIITGMGGDMAYFTLILGHTFQAKVSYFGLVKLAPQEKKLVETRLVGTFGYLAPEYAGN